MARRVFITAAEASGDQHAAELARSLKELDPQIQIEGIGGAKMAAAGVTIHHETVGRAAMGWRGALRALEVSRWMKWTRAYFEKAPPDLHICVDSSAMNLPFAKLAKGLGVRVMYYIAPQLWASREGRMKKLRTYVDRVACIFPFEEAYFRSHGVNATFVGHPLFDALPKDRFAVRGPRYPEAPPVIGIVPGSRRSEIQGNLPHLLDVSRRIRAQYPQARFLIPTTDGTHGLVTGMLGDEKVEVDRDGFDRVVPQCDLCLVKSGTGTVHVAAFGVPMIVVYRLNPLLWHGIARWLIKTPKLAMVNILAGNGDVVPEFIPWYGSNDGVAGCALDLLKHPEKLVEQRGKLRALIATIDRPGASMNAARMAMEMMK
jgi:lipid-A-disaccharide synthase